MRYIRTYEDVKDKARLRSKFVGKFTIVRTPTIRSFAANDHLIIYVVPRTWSGPLYREYTIFDIARIDNITNKIRIFISEIDLYSKDFGVPAPYVSGIKLEELENIAIYTTKKYEDAIEKLELIGITSKYNL